MIDVFFHRSIIRFVIVPLEVNKKDIVAIGKDITTDQVKGRKKGICIVAKRLILKRNTYQKIKNDMIKQRIKQRNDW